MSVIRYRLIDFGDGRKLESLGDYIIDRSSPAALGKRRAQPQRWANADAKYDEVKKAWDFRRPFPQEMLVDCGRFVMPVRPTPFGHLGFFPEQQSNWQWLADSHLKSSKLPARNSLNLFAYTGASTMALATAGFQVAHVDAAKPNVNAARQAAHANELEQAPIRYLVDDAAKFAAREVRRNRVYHTIVLDPPAYGHSPNGKAWRLSRDLWPLMENCCRLIHNHSHCDTQGDKPRMLVTGHSSDVGIQEIESFLRINPVIQSNAMEIESKRSGTRDASGRQLDAGFQVRITIG